MNRLLLPALAVAFLAFGWWCHTTAAETIPADIGARSTAALAEAGIDDVRLQVDGRDVHLAGLSSVTLESAREVLNRVRGIRRVTTTTMDEQALEAFRRALDNILYAKPQNAWFNIGIAYFQTERFDEALQAFMRQRKDSMPDAFG